MSALAETLVGLWEALPSAVAAALVLLSGWLAALLLRLLVSGLLGLLRFDRLSERAGLAEFLRKGAVTYSPSKLAGAIAYWIVILAALYRAALELDVGIAAALADKAKGLLPSLLAAVFVAVVGAILVSFLANFTLTIARNAGTPHAPLISRSIRATGDILVVSLALEQLGLGGTVLSTLLVILFAAVALGLALAFGIGGADLAKGALQNLLRNLRERARSDKGGDLEG